MIVEESTSLAESRVERRSPSLRWATRFIPALDTASDLRDRSLDSGTPNPGRLTANYAIARLTGLGIRRPCR